MLTPERLKAIKERCERATEPPWEVEGRGGAHMNGSRDYYIVVRGGDIRNASLWTLDDAEFAAHAREDVPALVAEVERLQAFLGELRELVRRWRREAARYRRKADVASDETNFAGYDGQAMALMRCASDLEDMLNQLEDGAHA